MTQHGTMVKDGPAPTPTLKGHRLQTPMFKVDRRRHPGLRKELRIAIPAYNPHQANAPADDHKMIWAGNADAILADLEASTTWAMPASSRIDQTEEVRNWLSDADTWAAEDGEGTDTETLLSDIDSLTALKDVDIDDHEARGPTTPAAADLDDGACMALLPECETETLLQKWFFDVADSNHFVSDEFLPR